MDGVETERKRCFVVWLTVVTCGNSCTMTNSWVSNKGGLSSGKITNVLLDWCATPDPAICPNGCGHFYRGINRKKLLRRHMVYECGVPSKFKCPICSKRFTRKSNMKVHAFSVHQTFL
ncbi:uncharacterized protein LOC115034171 [Acyrthosiphon pisum]|uniref:C2H2-type domain-containing protein n=1 Tax=Acyrthosiphon pisum TaxID=7029 RepID=A0A8R2JSZ0_ACYPI|nr:uncharacterized protein LOC115034171 [Acyrthosiphon pisum]